MAWVLEDSKVVEFINDNTPTFTLPSTPAAGNLLWLNVVYNFPNNQDDLSAEGWTRLYSTTDGGDYAAVFYKIAGASEPSIEINTSNASSDPVVYYFEFSGNASSSVLDTSNRTLTPSGSQPFSVGSITPSASDALLLAFHQIDRQRDINGSTFTMTGYTALNWAGGSSYRNTSGIAYKESGTTSSVNPEWDNTDTSAAAGGHVGIASFLAPAASVPTLSTPTVANINQTTATLGCTVTY